MLSHFSPRVEHYHRSSPPHLWSHLRCTYCNSDLIKVKQVTHHWCHTANESISYQKIGGFVEQHLAPMIFDYADWVAYPSDHRKLQAHNDLVTDVVISTDGIHLFTADDDGLIIQWNLKFGIVFKRWKAHSESVTCLDYHTCLLASGSSDDNVIVWDTHDHTILQLFDTDHSYVSRVKFNNTGEYLIMTVGTLIQLWSLRNGDCLKSWKSKSFGRILHTYLLRDELLLFSKSGRMTTYNVHTLSKQGTVTIQSPRKSGDNMIDINSDRTLIAYASRERVLILKWPSLDLLSTINREVSCLCFHPNHPHLLAVSGLRVYDVLHSQFLYRIYGDESNDHSRLLFTPDGLRLISILPESKDVRFWDIPLAILQAKGAPDKINVYE